MQPLLREISIISRDLITKKHLVLIPIDPNLAHIHFYVCVFYVCCVENSDIEEIVDCLKYFY